MDILQRKKATLSAYRDFFDTTEGKIVLKDLMKVVGYNESNFSADPHEHAYNEGQRTVVARILKTAKLSDKEMEQLFKHEPFEN